MDDRRISKVTISLPTPLLDFADRIARERSTTRSGLISELLRQEEETQIQALMAEGYREMAEENRKLAEEAFPLIAEEIRRSTRWEK